MNIGIVEMNMRMIVAQSCKSEDNYEDNLRLEIYKMEVVTRRNRGRKFIK